MIGMEEMDGIEEPIETIGSKKIELMDFPDEVLLNIMLHMNDTTLLNMTRVCKQSQAIAKEAFEKRYNGRTYRNYFTLRVFHENLISERKQYQPFFGAFGENMLAIDIFTMLGGPLARNHWIPADLIWRMKKLVFSTTTSKLLYSNSASYSVSYETVRSFSYPSLTHLEVLILKIENAAPILDHGDHFRHLTVLKFGLLNESVNKFLMAFDKHACEQLQELFIGSQLLMDNVFDNDERNIDGLNKNVMELVNIVPRFRKLTTLQLIVRDVERYITTYFFEKCSNLMHFGIWCYGKYGHYDNLFENIMENCMQIKTIRLFGHGIQRNLLQRVRRMFPEVKLATQDNIAFSITDQEPCYIETTIQIKDPLRNYTV